ncbi:iron complex transport system substrate-binding protein [Ulvibacter sp. MAR_2010_11]|uniref:ABC transporter substrate-binding protein n=1 Tax=Ulvibacter sp. MAR_2010_11 TaxID=1250229 RepID=UPI000C2C5109|nr:ABC transporter substrate-binding protein [Ulvibacter sp. MAR_2010_11]PKA83944.1 iron complex transport system substrate-binding protein [Ulvibacter sp. MAR_2010_11]
MQKLLPLFLLVLLGISCKEIQKSPSIVHNTTESTTITYAEGFAISHFEGFKTITINTPWPDSENTFTYAFVEKGTQLKDIEKYDAVVEVPIQQIVVTSTTHIPSLEMLDATKTLVGFPNLDYISSEATRKRIDAGKITELGKNEDINTEVLIDLAPDAVITFAVEGNNKTVATIQKTGIPVLYNADWTETSPLGKAEWIKFFGVLFNKEKEADSIFKTIETEYLAAKKLASEATQRPTVLSGAMYRDVWYLPQGNSWAAQFIADANGEYLWQDTEGTGSHSLNLEAVLEKGQHADFWIGPGQFTSLEQLKNTHSVYTKFDTYTNQKIFSSTTKKGATGGVIYYELAPNRPDLVLKDIIKILHPSLLPNHELFFFSKIH